MTQAPTYTVLSGGVGGAKLVLGLQEVLDAGQLQVIANTGDDFVHMGLPVCPDIDTLLYTLSGNANTDAGWGRSRESWHFMEALEQLGGETWFRLGDRDMATHVYRRALLDNGLNLSEATARLATALGVPSQIHPMSDTPVRTLIGTANGELEFQEYFVRQQARPVATSLRFAGSDVAAPSKGATQALEAQQLAAIIVSPSNPWLSIAPLLAIAELKSALLSTAVPVIAVSPIVGGKAIKGPTAKLMRELGVSSGVMGIAEHYCDLLDGLVIDHEDEQYKSAIETMGLHVTVTNTIMNNLSDKKQLALHVIDFASTLSELKS